MVSGEVVVDLSDADAAAIASLAAIGTQSGATVVGLSAVRRCSGLAYIFVDADLAPGTVAELTQRAKRSTGRCRVFRLNDLTTMTSRFGRIDALVIAIRHGDLASGIGVKLSSSRNTLENGI